MGGQLGCTELTPGQKECKTQSFLAAFTHLYNYCSVLLTHLILPGRMCACVYLCPYICLFACMYVRARAYVCLPLRVCFVFVYVCTIVFVHVCMYVCTYVCAFVCMFCVCEYVFFCVCMRACVRACEYVCMCFFASVCLLMNICICICICFIYLFKHFLNVHI